MAKLGTPRIKVVLSDPEYPGDDEGRDYVVQARNIDLCAFDRERGRYGWPKADDAPFLWMTYVSWKALVRTGQIPQCPLAEFEQRCLSVESLGDNDVDPTPPEATAG